MPPLGPRAQPKPKRKVAKPPPYKAPTTDVQSSGGDYGTKKAQKYKKTKDYKKSVRKAYTSQPVKKRQELLKAPASAEKTVVVREHRRRVAQRKKKVIEAGQHGAYPGPTKSDLKQLQRIKVKKKEAQHAGIVPDLGKIQKGIGSFASQVAKLNVGTDLAHPGAPASKIIQNAAREAIDIPSSTVPTIAHIAEPLLQHPLSSKARKEAGKQVVEASISLPKALIKDPAKTVVEHPLSTALLLNPVGKLPVRGARLVERRAGSVTKGPLKVVPKAPGEKVAKLPGTKMEVIRPPTTGYARNIKKAVKPESKTVTKKDIQTRVDEDVALMEGMTRRQGAIAAKKIYKDRKKVVSKKQAGHEAAETAASIQKALHTKAERAIENEMALRTKPHYVATPKGPKLQADYGNVAKYDTLDEAKSVASQAQVGDVKFVPKPVGNKYIVLPEAAKQRWEQHTKPADFGPITNISRMYTTHWRRNVLALHPTWYVGNVLEAAVRAAVSGVGPASVYRGYKVAKTLEQTNPAAAEALKGRIYQGGHLSMQINITKDLRNEAENMRLGKPGLHKVIRAWEGFSDFTMGTLSGRAEGAFQKAMMGKALAKDPLMNDHMIKISRGAIEDAAKGLTNTKNQVQLGRVVDEMYGKYGKWSPDMRFWIANYTPFISWTMNAANFLYRTLPRDHPVLTALQASVQPYVDEWRKQKGLSRFVKGAVPAFLQGAIPSKEGFARYPTRYTPFAAAAQYPEDIGDLFLPQYSAAIEMAKFGVNWKGQKVKNPDGTELDPLQRTVAALLTLYEGAIPASQQIQGPSQRYEKGARGADIFKLKSAKEIQHAFDPFSKVSAKKPVKKKKKSPAEDYFSGAGSTSAESYFK